MIHGCWGSPPWHGQEPISWWGAARCAGVDRWPGDQSRPKDPPGRIGVGLDPNRCTGPEVCCYGIRGLRRILTGSWHFRMDDPRWPAGSPPAYETMEFA